MLMVLSVTFSALVFAITLFATGLAGLWGALGLVTFAIIATSSLCVVRAFRDEAHVTVIPNFAELSAR